MSTQSQKWAESRPVGRVARTDHEPSACRLRAAPAYPPQLPRHICGSLHAVFVAHREHDKERGIHLVGGGSGKRSVHGPGWIVLTLVP